MNNVKLLPLNRKFMAAHHVPATRTPVYVYTFPAEDSLQEELQALARALEATTPLVQELHGNTLLPFKRNCMDSHSIPSWIAPS
jgi:hypothetical protein